MLMTLLPESLCGEFNVRVEYKRSITVRHNTLIFVIQCYMFQFNEQSTGIILQQCEKNIIN